jgi:deoxyinosine 3'endonuclease (endonuclease V)
VFLVQVAAVHVRVALRGADVGVAQHLLHGHQVRPALQQVRGERVSASSIWTI